MTPAYSDHKIWPAMKGTLRKDGDDFVVVLPADVVERLAWESGDAVEVSVNGTEVRIVRSKTEHDRAMEIAEQVMDEYREVFETLAKT
jgi:putative addiction module antidote